jgi:hypothetical protein
MLSSGKTALSKDRVSEEASRLDTVILMRNFSRSAECIIMVPIYLFCYVGVKHDLSPGRAASIEDV